MHVRRIRVTDREEWLRLQLALWPETTPDEHVGEMEELLDDPENTARILRKKVAFPGSRSRRKRTPPAVV